MKPSALAVLILAFTLLTGCASKKPAGQPDWISGDSAAYSSSQYLIGRGISASEDEAKDRARADLAKTFQVAVLASSEDVQKFKTGNGGPGEYEGQASRNISTRTDQVIRGVQIAELWQDPVSKDFHVLAVLPRLQAAASLRQQIAQLDEATANYVEKSRRNSDLFLKIAAANQAVESQQERQSLQKSLQIVDATGRAPDSSWSAAKLNGDLDELLKRVRIASQVPADSPAGLERVAAGALARAGFMLETGQNPDFVLHTRMELTDIGNKEGWYWKRGVLEITLSEAASSRVRGTKRWAIKSNAPDRESAETRALNQADATLKQELRATLIEMATNR